MAKAYTIGTQKGADLLARVQNGYDKTVTMSDGTQIYRTTSGNIVAERNGVQMPVQNNYTPTTQPQSNIPQTSHPVTTPVLPTTGGTVAPSSSKNGATYTVGTQLGSDVYNALLTGKINTYNSTDGRTWYVKGGKVYVYSDPYGEQPVQNTWTGGTASDYTIGTQLGSDVYNDILTGKRTSYSSKDGRKWFLGADGNVYVESPKYGIQKVITSPRDDSNDEPNEDSDEEYNEENSSYLEQIKALEERLKKAEDSLTTQTKLNEDERLKAQEEMRKVLDEIEKGYQSRREEEIARNKANLENYSYDNFKNSSEYADILSAYEQNGSRAMQNTLAEISARTGGLPSSYATSAAQQAYNNYLTNAEREAQQSYDTEFAKLLQLYQNEIGLDEQDYSRWQQGVANRLGAAAQLSDMDYRNQANALNWYNAQNNTQLGWYNALHNSEVNEQNAELARRKQELAELQYRNIYGTASEATARERAYETAITNAYGGDFSALASYWGTTPEAARARFAAMTAKQVGSAKLYKGVSYNPKPALSASEARKAVEDGIINDTTKAAYEYYFGEIPEDVLPETISDAGNKKLTGLTASQYKELLKNTPDIVEVAETMKQNGYTNAEIRAMLSDAYNSGLLARGDYQKLLKQHA